MSIEMMKGNLLGADVQALVNAVNCVGIMGKGIALQFKYQYPDMYAEYVRACWRGDVKIGRMHVFRVDQLAGPDYIINFPTKIHWRDSSSLAWIEEGLQDLVKCVIDLQIESIAIPPLGVGNGGLSWVDVEPLIRAAVEDLPILVELYSPIAQSRPVDLP